MSCAIAFATRLVNAECSPEVLRRQLRHHDVSVSLGFYVQTTQADVEGAVARAFGYPPKPLCGSLSP